MNYEKELAKAIKRKDTNRIEELFEMIYFDFGTLVGFIISKYVSRKEDIEELVNDVFLQFSKVLFDIKLKNIKYYLVVSAKNISINFLKRKEHKLYIEYNEEYVNNQKDLLHENSRYYELISMMEEYLTEFEINVILLHSVYDYSFKELSIKYQKPASTINSTYHRAIEKISKMGDKK